VGLIRFAVVFAVLAVSAPAYADNTPTQFDQTVPAMFRLPASAIASASAVPVAPAKKSKKSDTGCNENGCGYKALLGGLFITRDFQVSTKLSLRMLPTSHALGGDDAKTPIVVRPETKGEDYYGVRVHAAF
jgi:hypothetical protein